MSDDQDLALKKCVLREFTTRACYLFSNYIGPYIGVNWSWSWYQSEKFSTLLALRATCTCNIIMNRCVDELLSYLLLWYATMHTAF